MFLTSCGGGLCVTAASAGCGGTVTFGALHSESERSARWSLTGTFPPVKYRLYYSHQDNLGSVAEVKANGTPVGNDYVELSDYLEFHGRKPSKEYHFALLEYDPEFNEELFVGSTQVAAVRSSTLRGRADRACGLDTDRDGILGEPEDCRVCSGMGGASDSIYLIANAGEDNTQCGTVDAPCRTIQYALDNRVTEERHTLCLSGKFSESVSLNRSGASGFYLRDDFRYPSNPIAIIGWDRDGDRKYPPFDSDDEAVIDGGNTLNYAFRTTLTGGSFMEIAHLSVVNFFNGGPGVGGGFWNARAAAPSTYLYFHDLRFEGNTDDSTGGEYASLIWQQDNGGSLQYLAFENNFLDAESQILWVTDNSATQNLLFRENSVNHVFRSAALAYEGFITQDASDVTIRDNHFEVDRTRDTSSRFFGVVPSTCSQRFTVVNNNFINVSGAFVAGPVFLRPCDTTRRIDSLAFEKNLVKLSFGGPVPFAISTFDETDPTYGTLAYSVKDVSFTNNILVGVGNAMEACFSLGYSNTATPQDGITTVIGNTCVNPKNQGILISRSNPVFWSQSFRIQGNLVHSESPALFARTEYTPTDFQSDRNIYSGSASQFDWDFSGPISFTTWRGLNLQDVNSSLSCDVSFADSSNLDYHTASTDTCSRSVGSTNYISLIDDYDGEARTAANDRAGADITD